MTSTARCGPPTTRAVSRAPSTPVARPRPVRPGRPAAARGLHHAARAARRRIDAISPTASAHPDGDETARRRRLGRHHRHLGCGAAARGSRGAGASGLPPAGPARRPDLMVRTAVDVSAGRCFNRPGMNHAATAGRDLATGTGLVERRPGGPARPAPLPAATLAAAGLDAARREGGHLGPSGGGGGCADDRAGRRAAREPPARARSRRRRVRPSTPPGPDGFMMSPWRPVSCRPSSSCGTAARAATPPRRARLRTSPPDATPDVVETLTAWFRDHGLETGRRSASRSP